MTVQQLHRIYIGIRNKSWHFLKLQKFASPVKVLTLVGTELGAVAG